MQKTAEKRGLLTIREWDTRTELKVEVFIKETRKQFGRTDYLVTPVAGSGEAWKSGATVTLI